MTQLQGLVKQMECLQPRDGSILVVHTPTAKLLSEQAWQTMRNWIDRRDLDVLLLTAGPDCNIELLDPEQLRAFGYVRVHAVDPLLVAMAEGSVALQAIEELKVVAPEPVGVTFTIDLPRRQAGLFGRFLERLTARL